MTTRAVAEMREWDGRQYDGGFDGLHDLADREFTGAVEADGAVCFMLRGRVVGVFETDEEADHGLRSGDIGAFEHAAGTAYEAPHAALPLLFTMQATGGEERGRYYTEDTPLEEVHERLSGGFTGYVELSENVLSGDYYSVYHGGRAKHVAFVGQSRRLLEDEEAFERSCDEVGIYTVTAVDLDITEIPGGEERTAAGAGVAGADGAGAADAGAAGAAGAGAGGAAGESDSAPGGGARADADDPSLDADIPEAGSDTAGEADAAAAGADTEEGTGAETEMESEREAETPHGDQADTTSPRGTGRDSSADDAIRPAATLTDDGDEGNGTAADPGDTDPEVGTDERDGGDDQQSDAAATEAVSPSPATGPADDDIEAAVTSVEEASAESEPEPEVAESPDESPAEQLADEGPGSETAPEPAASGGDVATLKRTLEDRESEVERLEREVDRLESELRTVRDERDDLAARVENLEARLQELGSGAAAPESSMTASEALSGTNLFVRYRSKSEPTLDDLSDGVSREGVIENLRLERHTEFDAEAVAVDGRQFDAFLEGTQEYRFARWLVSELPLEIRDTGTQRKLADLYGALPDIDRIEFGATVADDQTFDLVARNRMGEPLVIATLDDSREPTQGEELAALVRGGSAVSEESGSLAGAMAATGAFFEPEALATAEEATGGSLLSRDKRESYVKLSRGRGFHLCLVEDRDESFYLSVPEL